MATPFIRANPYTGRIGSTRILTITTAAAQQVTLGTGHNYFHLFNNGSGNLIWGDSNIAVNSGGYIFPYAAREWENLPEVWSVFLTADSVSTVISVNEGFR